jgi:3-hydroxyisobutyrate dehydrogenase-like beta-hydroxyacid dehydrogenase
MRAGFIGLGMMGSGMAANLLRAGHEVTVYNRTPGKVTALAAQGARAAGSIAEACQGEAVLTMLADDAALEAVMAGEGGVLASLAPGAIHVSMSTVGTATTERLAARHAAAGQRFIAAPVFGRPEAAAAGELFILAAGPDETISVCQGLFDAMGQRTYRFGEHPASASLVKLSGNFLIAATIEAFGEAFALIEKAGVSREAYLEMLTGTLFTAPLHKGYGGAVAAGRFAPPGFAAPLGFKDVRLTQAAAEELRVPMPLAGLLRERFLALLAQPGGEQLDWAAISQVSRRDAGLP